MTVEFVYIAFIIKSYISVFEFFEMLDELDDCCDFIPDWNHVCSYGGIYIDGEMNDGKFDQMIDYVKSHPRIEIDHDAMLEAYNYGSC